MSEPSISTARVVEASAPQPLDRGSTARENALVLWHIYTATAALALGALFGMLQSLSRANFISMPPAFDHYRMLTAHGVLMALVFTTFFITGLSTYATYRSILRENRSLRLAWIGYAVMVVGTVMAAATAGAQTWHGEMVFAAIGGALCSSAC